MHTHTYTYSICNLYCMFITIEVKQVLLLNMQEI